MTARDLTMEQILIYLRDQKAISDLGKDILSTYDILCCNPFNRNDAASRIILNNAKHPEIRAVLALGPDLVAVDLSRTSEVGTWNCLYLQFREMCREEAVTLGDKLEENAPGRQC